MNNIIISYRNSIDMYLLIYLSLIFLEFFKDLFLLALILVIKKF